jgi:hypothetical protein
MDKPTRTNTNTTRRIAFKLILDLRFANILCGLEKDDIVFPPSILVLRYILEKHF